MALPYDGHASGLKKALTGSAVVHALILAALLVIGWSGKNRIIQETVFVDIVSSIPRAPGPANGQASVSEPPDIGGSIKGAEEKKALQKSVTKDTAEKADVKIPAKETAKKEHQSAKKPSVKETVQKKEAAAKHKEMASVEEALKRVAENVRKKDEAAEVESRIADIRRRDEAEQGAVTKRLAEVKKSLAQRTPSAGAPAGRDTSPGRMSAVEAKYPAYYSIIKDRVQAAWIYPEGFNANEVSIVISIKIAKSGRLIDSWVEKGSGNKNFDDSLINAVRKAAPFPPLPQDFKNVYLETGLRFCPLCKE